MSSELVLGFAPKGIDPNDYYNAFVCLFSFCGSSPHCEAIHTLIPYDTYIPLTRDWIAKAKNILYESILTTENYVRIYDNAIRNAQNCDTLNELVDSLDELNHNLQAYYWLLTTLEQWEHMPFEDIVLWAYLG